MRISVIIVIILFSVGAFSQNELTLEPSPLQPNLAEEFYIIVSNQSKEPVEFIGVSIEHLDKIKWKQARSDIECPCMAKCKKAISKLEPGESSKVEWDFKDNSCNQITTAGIYRAVVSGSWSEAEHKNLVLGQSGDFSVLK